jgi:hypothetical protein
LKDLGEPLRRGVLALRAALASSRRAIRYITRLCASTACASRTCGHFGGWFRFYPSRFARSAHKKTTSVFEKHTTRIFKKQAFMYK